jgi:hypothetical protein
MYTITQQAAAYDLLYMLLVVGQDALVGDKLGKKKLLGKGGDP